MLLKLLYIPEHLIGVEARTSLGRSRRQIPMTDNLGIRKHLMEDGQQVSQSLRLSRRAGVAGQSVLVQPALIADTNGAMVVWQGMSPDLKQHAVLRHRAVTADIGINKEINYHTFSK